MMDLGDIKVTEYFDNNSHSKKKKLVGEKRTMSDKEIWCVLEAMTDEQIIAIGKEHDLNLPLDESKTKLSNKSEAIKYLMMGGCIGCQKPKDK